MFDFFTHGQSMRSYQNAMAARTETMPVNTCLQLSWDVRTLETQPAWIATGPYGLHVRCVSSHTNVVCLAVAGYRSNLPYVKDSNLMINRAGSIAPVRTACRM